ncbi:hypothetical protein [Nonomuraea recticatena]|uniref:hypothetical protein n=1 Tax=Nonomuraea recticatena TaxID=46178 RepID=UPI003613A334
MNSTERRRILAAAALGRTPGHAGPDRESGDPLHAVTGQIVDVSPHLLIVETEEGSEERLVIAPWATAWHGADVAPGDLPSAPGSSSGPCVTARSSSGSGPTSPA